MTKSADRQEALLDALADHVLANGLPTLSLRPLARAAGLSDRMLLYHFKDKAEVVAVTLAHLAARMARLLDERGGGAPRPLARLRAELAALLDDPAFWPFLRLWLEIAALAARGDPLFGRVGEAIGRGFLSWGAAQLDSADPAARDADAARLLVTVEGLVLLRAIGLGDVAARAAAAD